MLFNKYLHVSVLFGIDLILQIIQGSEGDGADYQPEVNNITEEFIIIYYYYIIF